MGFRDSLSGGVRLAMAGAQSAEGLDAALADVQAWVEAKL